MAMGECTTIVYFYPVLCGLFAKRFLNEELGWGFWRQAGICGAGVLLVTSEGLMQSSGSSYKLGMALALCAAFGYAADVP